MKYLLAGVDLIVLVLIRFQWTAHIRSRDPSNPIAIAVGAHANDFPEAPAVLAETFSDVLRLLSNQRSQNWFESSRDLLLDTRLAPVLPYSSVGAGNPCCKTNTRIQQLWSPAISNLNEGK